MLGFSWTLGAAGLEAPECQVQIPSRRDGDEILLGHEALRFVGAAPTTSTETDKIS